MSKCKGCQAAVVWCRTAAGKWIPVDAKPNPEGNLVLRESLQAASPKIAVVVNLFTDPELERYMPHHATCPDVEDFR